MEKKSNLPNVDELCVKYVFDELDPSEITFVEQAMIDDQNLLIEVESLKSTWRKLKTMPELDPPDQLSQSIIDSAREHASQQQIFGNSWNNPGLLATAAVVIFSLLITTAYLLPGGEQPAAADNDTRIARTGSIATSFHVGSQNSENPFGHWFNKENVSTIVLPDQIESQSAPDTVTNGITEEGKRQADPVFMSPALRGFQLTGTEF